MSLRSPLTVALAWRGWPTVLAGVLVLAACAPPAAPTQVAPPPTTILKTGKAQITLAPSAAAPRLVVAGAEGELLAARAGIVRPEDSPAEYAMFWDYSAAAGALAFASAPWQRSASGNLSVSDFWVHDYSDGGSTRWFASNVGRVLWAPDADDGTRRVALVVFDRARGGFSLAIATAPGEARVVAEAASYAFSWAPDGSQLAYVRRAPPTGLYVVDADGGPALKLSDFAYQDGGWLFDKPLWMPEHGVLIVAENYDRPLRAVLLDGSAEFIPTAPDGGRVSGPRPDVMLWARGRRQLVLSGESGFAPETWVHTFSADLRTVEHSLWLAATTLKGWWQPGESVLLLGPAGAEVHALPAP